VQVGNNKLNKATLVLEAEELTHKTAADKVQVLYAKWGPDSLPPAKMHALLDELVASKAKQEQMKQRIAGVKASIEENEDHKASYRKAMEETRFDVQDVSTKCALIPVQLFTKAPKNSGAGTIGDCKYYDRGFIANTFVPLSCRCNYHPPCVMEMILSNRLNCIECNTRIHGLWMAIWGFSLNKNMECEVQDDLAKVEADPNSVGPTYHQNAIARGRTPVMSAPLLSAPPVAANLETSNAAGVDTPIFPSPPPDTPMAMVE
jgi:hypothetical protein